MVVSFLPSRLVHRGLRPGLSLNGALYVNYIYTDIA